MGARFVVIAGAVAALATAGAATGSSTDTHGRNYGPAAPAAVLSSAPGGGLVKRATFIPGNAQQPAASTRYVPTPLLLTARGAHDKAEAEKGLLTTGKRVLTPSRTPSAPAAAAANSFQAIGMGQSNSTVPDVQIAAGPYHVVEAVNGRITIFNKNGNSATSFSAQTLFAPLGGVASGDIFDPQIQYDEYIGRFVVLEAERDDSVPQSNLLLAVSYGNDPTEGWSLYAFNARVNGGTDTNYWCDYDHLGFDAQAFYFTCDMFPVGSDSGFQYAKVRVMTTAEFFNGGCCYWWDYWNFREGNGSRPVFAIQPLVSHDAIPSDGGFLVAADGEGGSGSTIHVYRIPNPQNCCTPGSQSYPGLDQKDQGVGSYSPPPDAVQPNNVQGIDTGDSRVLFAVSRWPRMFMSQNLADGSDSTVSYTEFNFGAFPTLTTNNDWTLGGDAMNRYFGGGEVNFDDDKSMVYSASNASTFAGTRWIQIPSPNVCTVCFDGEFTLRDGGNTFLELDQNNANRWGDYLDAARDPDGIGIWIGGEFASSLQDFWGSQIGLTRQQMDTSPPSTTSMNIPPANSNGWNKGTVEVQLSSTDSGFAGVRYITYAASGANQIPYTQVNGNVADVHVYNDGDTALEYFATDKWGNGEALKTLHVKIDSVLPKVTSPPNPTFQAGTTLTATQVPVRIGWTGSDATSGICKWELQRSDNGGSFTSVSLPTKTATHADVLVTPGGTTHRFRVRATDCAGNASAFTLGRTFTVTNHAENAGSIAYSSGWTRVADSNAFGGFVKLSTSAGKTAKDTFTGHNVAWVARKSSAAGTASVQVDGGSPTSVNLNSGSTQERRIVFTKGNLAAPGSHSVTITNLGTGGTAHEVNVDSFLWIS